MRAFGEQLEKAGHVWVNTLTEAVRELDIEGLTPEEAATKEERIALDIARWLGLVFATSTLPLNSSAEETIRAIGAPLAAPSKKIDWMQPAKKWTKHWCEMFRQIRTWQEEMGDDYKGNPPEYAAECLVHCLETMAHPAFGNLESRIDEVVAQLDRYSHDNYFKNVKGEKVMRGEPKANTRKNSNGILTELTGMAGIKLAQTELSKKTKK